MSQAPEHIEAPVRCYQIGAIAVELQTNVRAVRDAYDWSYEPYRVNELVYPDIRLDAVQTRRRWRRGPIDIRTNGVHRFTLAHDTNPAPYLDWAVNWTVATGLPRFVALHAAVVARDGQAVLLAAAPESGKSTMSAALVLSGWRYLCDEFALVEPDGLRVHPYPKAIALKDPSPELLVRFAGEFPVRACQVPSFGRVCLLAPHRLGSDVVASPVIPRLIVFPRVSAGVRPCLRPLSAAEAVFRLTRTCFNFLSFGSSAIETFERLVRTARCFEMSVGDLSESVNLVERAWSDADLPARRRTA